MHCHSDRFIVSPDSPAQDSAPRPSAEARLAANLRRRIAEDWESLPPSKRDRLYHQHGAALAIICGVPAWEAGKTLRGIKGVRRLLEEIEASPD